MDVQTTFWLGFRSSPAACHMELVLRQLQFQGGLHAGAHQIKDQLNNNINSTKVFSRYKNTASEAAFFSPHLFSLFGEFCHVEFYPAQRVIWCKSGCTSRVLFGSK